MNFKLLGGILLIMGTSIGAGILALPVATASLGVFGIVSFLLLVWALMTYAAFLVLEVNLWLPPGTNIITMSKVTLGLPGQLIAWSSYLLLLYCLMAAYTAGGGDIFQHFAELFSVVLPSKVYAICFVLVISFVVYQGIRAVDHVNRLLMSIKLFALFALIFSLMPFVSVKELFHTHFQFHMAAIVIMVTSFGYATIVPSLRVYFEDDVPTLKKVIFIGSLIPLICYLLWVVTIHGVLPEAGPNGLAAILSGGHAASALMAALTTVLKNPWITSFSDAFASVSVVTSFLAVSLGLSDFLADGLQMKKIGWRKVAIMLVTFLPPLMLVLFYPGLFITGLAYAGLFCVILLMFLPAAMAWSGRYRRGIATGYRVAGGRFALVLVFIATLVLTLFFRP